MHALVAEDDSGLVGLAHYNLPPQHHDVGPGLLPADLFTDASQRGKGVGRALIEAVYGEARRAGSPRVYWHTHETNQTAMALYDKVAQHSGFVVYRKEL